jgi:hypothetical protein
MEYTDEDTTKRYNGNKKCAYAGLKPIESDKYQYGCEFEFYIDENKYEYKVALNEIIQKIYKLTDSDILVDIVKLPIAEDRNHCIQIKPDHSLGNNGIEISIPISSKKGIKHFLEKILKIIEEYGYTDETTGLHFHISTVDKDGVNFKFYKYMLICEDAKLLSSWEPRIGYSQNVMDILLNHTKLEAKQIKTGKGTVWNLEKISPNHIEIKTIGGEQYHTFLPKILKEFEQFSSYFHEALQKDEPRHKELMEQHQTQVINAETIRQKRYMEALEESGIIDKETKPISKQRGHRR